MEGSGGSNSSQHSLYIFTFSTSGDREESRTETLDKRRNSDDVTDRRAIQHLQYFL